MSSSDVESDWDNEAEYSLFAEANITRLIAAAEKLHTSLSLFEQAHQKVEEGSEQLFSTISALQSVREDARPIRGMFNRIQFQRHTEEKIIVHCILLGPNDEEFAFRPITIDPFPDHQVQDRTIFQNLLEDDSDFAKACNTADAKARLTALNDPVAAEILGKDLDFDLPEIPAWALQELRRIDFSRDGAHSEALAVAFRAQVSVDGIGDGILYNFQNVRKKSFLPTEASYRSKRCESAFLWLFWCKDENRWFDLLSEYDTYDCGIKVTTGGDMGGFGGTEGGGGDKTISWEYIAADMREWADVRKHCLDGRRVQGPAVEIAFSDRILPSGKIRFENASACSDAAKMYRLGRTLRHNGAASEITSLSCPDSVCIDYLRRFRDVYPQTLASANPLVRLVLLSAWDTGPKGVEVLYEDEPEGYFRKLLRDPKRWQLSLVNASDAASNMSRAPAPGSESACVPEELFHAHDTLLDALMRNRKPFDAIEADVNGDGKKDSSSSRERLFPEATLRIRVQCEEIRQYLQLHGNEGAVDLGTPFDEPQQDDSSFSHSSAKRRKLSCGGGCTPGPGQPHHGDLNNARTSERRTTLRPEPKLRAPLQKRTPKQRDSALSTSLELKELLCRIRDQFSRESIHKGSMSYKLSLVEAFPRFVYGAVGFGEAFRTKLKSCDITLKLTVLNWSAEEAFTDEPLVLSFQSSDAARDAEAHSLDLLYTKLADRCVEHFEAAQQARSAAQEAGRLKELPIYTAGVTGPPLPDWALLAGVDAGETPPRWILSEPIDVDVGVGRGVLYLIYHEVGQRKLLTLLLHQTNEAGESIWREVVNTSRSPEGFVVVENGNRGEREQPITGAGASGDPGPQSQAQSRWRFSSSNDPFDYLYLPPHYICGPSQTREVFKWFEERKSRLLQCSTMTFTSCHSAASAAHKKLRLAHKLLKPAEAVTGWWGAQTISAAEIVQQRKDQLLAALSDEIKAGESAYEQYVNQLDHAFFRPYLEYVMRWASIGDGSDSRRKDELRRVCRQVEFVADGRQDVRKKDDRLFDLLKGGEGDWEWQGAEDGKSVVAMRFYCCVPTGMLSG